LYYGLADHYALLDQFYSSVRSFSLPNHWYEIAGQAPYLSIAIGVRGSHTSAYEREANAIPTLADLLVRSSTSWKYYDNPLPQAYGNDATDLWNPYLAKKSTFTVPYSSHFVARSQFLNDAALNTLPAVSYVIPNTQLSEHPPNNVQTGQDYVVNMVNAVMQSPAWNNTVIVIFWDDFGGFFDTSPPPQVDQFGYGFRVGALVVSPFVSQGVNHTVVSPESILKFVEQWQGLPSLTARDANSNSLSAVLDPQILGGTKAPVPQDIQPLTNGQRTNVNKLVRNRNHLD
jgi:phospholipase C